MADFYASYVGSGGGGSGGTGDVIGPASSDDNGLVLFNGISGKQIKQASGTGVVFATSGVASINAITASRAVVSNASGIPVAATTTAVEIGYVNGVTSSIQTQLNAKEPTLNPGDISTSTSGVTVGSGTNSTVGPNVTVDVQTASGSQPGLLSSADWTTFNSKQAALTPGNISTTTTGVSVGSGTASTVGPNVTVDVQTASGAQPGLLSSTDWTAFNSKQAGDATLTALAAYNTNGLMTQTAADTFTGRTITGTANRLSVSNGDGVSGNPTLNIDTAYVGQNTITTLGTITTGTWTGTTVAIANGGTGQTTAANAMNALLAPTPTAMTDAVATSLGLKQYVSGTNYNGGISPTITATNWTTTRGVFVPSQMQDGSWRLKFNFRGSRTTGSISNYLITVNGVTFKNVANFLQAVSFGLGNLAADSSVGWGCANPNAATIQLFFTSNDPTYALVSGDVELESKPTWAY